METFTVTFTVAESDAAINLWLAGVKHPNAGVNDVLFASGLISKMRAAYQEQMEHSELGKEKPNGKMETNRSSLS